MTLLASLLTPSFGLLVWMLIGFGLLVFILVKFAWPVITKSIAQREEYIETQLAEAEKIKSELANLSKKHDEMMAQTKAERDKILGDARKISEKTNCFWLMFFSSSESCISWATVGLPMG